MAEKRASCRTGIVLVAIGLALSIWVSWPLVRFLPSAIPYTFSAKPNERVAGLVPGDHLQYLYHLHLLREAVDGKISPFSNPYEFAGPYRYNTPYIYFPFALPYAGFSYVSPGSGYNALVLLSFVGTMVAGYGLARAWGATRWAGLCAGIVITLFPHRLNSLFGGHAAGSAFFLFPMAWWGLEKNWQTGKKGWGWMAALCLIVMGVEDTHHLFFFCLLLPFWALWKLLEREAVVFPEGTKGERSRLASVVSWQGMIAAALLAACYHFYNVRIKGAGLLNPAIIGLLLFFSLTVLGVALLIKVVLRWLGAGEGLFRKRWLSWPWASFWVLPGYFAANYVNKPGFGSKIVVGSLFLFGAFQLAFLARGIQKKRLSLGKLRIPWGRVLQLWPAVLGLVISVLYPLYLKMSIFPRSGVAGGRTVFEVSLFSVPFQKLFARSPEGGAYVGWAFIGLLLVGAVALFSSKRHKPGVEEVRRLRIAFVLTGLGMVLACGVLLGNVFPLYNVFLRLIPFLNYIRSTGKFLILTATGGAVTVALILTLLEGRLRRGVVRRWLSPAVAIVLILDWGLISKVGVSVLPRQNALYDVVKEEGRGTRLLELPIWPGDSAFSSAYQYGTMLTGVPTINGYSPMVPAGYKENIADPLYSLNFGMLGEKEFDLLKGLNVHLITFHQNLFPRQVSSLPATHSLKRLLLNPNLELVAHEGDAHLFKMVGQTYQNVPGKPCDEDSSVSYYVPYNLLKHQVGEESEDDEAITGKAWRSRGRGGFSFFGPFLMLPPGEYVAVFRVKVEAPRDAPQVGYLDVYTGEGTELATRQPLNPSDWPEPHGYRFVEIPFRVALPHPVQTRGSFAGVKEATVWLDFVLIRGKKQGQTIRLEAEDFFSSVGRVVKDGEAKEGVCLGISGSPKRGEPILEEAFIFLKAGRYEVRCSAKGEKGKMATLQMRRIAATRHYQRFDVQNGEGGEGFTVSKGVLNLATGGVHAVSLWPAEKRLKAVDYISFTLMSRI
ncbi:hypothetical protein HQ563_12100 [bacterium]|nr:hypothetical protein [bacterium]